MMKIKTIFLLVVVPLLFGLTTGAGKSEAEVNVSVGINLPFIRFAGPPQVTVIPGTYVYMVPDIEADILFFEGYWWRPHQGQWYRAKNYSGSWRHVPSRNIPHGLRALPQDYRHRLSPRYERIPQHEVKRNWKKWQKEKRWDRRDERGAGHPGEQGRGGDDRQKQRGRQ